MLDVILVFCMLSSQDGNERDCSATHVFYGELYACVNHPKLSEQQFRQLTHAIVDAERSSAAADKAALAGTYSIELYAAMEARAALTVWQLVTSKPFAHARDAPSEALYTRNHAEPLPAGLAVGYAANLCGAQLREFVCAVHLACLISEYGASVLRSGDAAHSAAVRECMRDMKAVTAAKLCELQLMSEQQAEAVAQDWVLPLAPCDPAVWRQWEAAMSDINAPFDPTQPTVEDVFGTADGKCYCCLLI
jgi:hypothetical protein